MVRDCLASLRGSLFGLTAICFLAAPVEAQTGRSLQTALSEMQNWLGQDQRGTAWRQFLQLEELEREAAKGSQANRAVVANSWGRFHSGVEGLQARGFQATRRALDQFATELRVPLALRWAGQAEGAQANVASISDSQVQRAKVAVVEAANELDQFLDRGDYKRASGWRSFLKWDDLQAQLRSKVPDIGALESVSLKLFDGHRGLELPAFAKVREALQNYVRLLNLQQAPTARQQLAQQFQLVAADLRQFNAAPSTKAAHDLAHRLHVMQQLGQLQHLAQQLFAQFQHPNVRLRLSEPLIARGVSRPVDETGPVDEMILGTHVTGTGRTVGQTTAELVPHSEVAMIAIRMTGHTQTHTIGRQDPVAIFSRGVTSIDAHKLLLLEPDVIRTLAAEARCEADNQIYRIQSNRRFGAKLIEKIAWKRAAQQLPSAEREGAARAELRVERRFDEQVAGLVAKGNDTLQSKLRAPLERRGLIPHSARFSSTDSHLFAQATQAGAAQLGAMSPPPAIEVADDAVLQLHESMVNNTAELAFAGLTLTDRRAAELVEEMTGEVPEALQISDEKSPWSISFDWTQPLTVEFQAGNKLRLAIRGRKFTNGNSVLNKSMEIAADYDMQLSSTGIRLIRNGELSVTFPDRRDDTNLTVRDLGFQTLMREKFSSLFKPVIEGEGVELPERWRSRQNLRLHSLNSADGWLTLGWN